VGNNDRDCGWHNTSMVSDHQESHLGFVTEPVRPNRAQVSASALLAGILKRAVMTLTQVAA